MISRAEFPLAPLSYLADVRPSGVDKHTHPDEVPVRLCNYTDIYYREHITNDIAFMEASATRAEMERFILTPGDVVMTKDSETADDIGIPALVVEEVDSVLLGYHNTLVRPSAKLEPRFLFWFLSSRVAAAYWETKARGVTRVGLRTEDVAALPVPLPPLSTQRRIADMLDAETARIDTLIEKNERVLELLDARRLSLVSIRTSGAGSDEGSFVPLRYLARLDPGKSEVKHLPDDLEVDFIPMEAVGHGGRLHPTETRPIGEVRDGYTYLRSGDVTFAKISPSFQNRKGGRAQGLTNGLAFATTELTILRPEPTTDARFLQYVIESEPFIQHGAATLHGVAGQQRVDLSRVAAFPVWSPDIETQRRIADMLDAETAKMHALGSAVHRQQELMRLRRQALITAAVTGESGA